MNIQKQFIKYVSQNICGMLGISCYIIVDTFFISQAAGTDGITVLNLVLPVYNLIFAIGSMIGVGSATRYTILKAQEDDSAKKYFANAILCILIISIPFVLSGIFSPDTVMHMMGADAGITQLGRTYTRIFLLFTPFFMMNYVFSAFVRNDNAPTLAMIGTMMGSFSNVVLDYVFMFPMGMGLATGVAFSLLIISLVWGFTDPMVALFNSEHSVKMAEYAFTGMRLYVIGFLFAGFNIIGTGYLSASEHAKEAFTASVCRGFVAIAVCSVILSRMFGIRGVWLSFMAAEALTAGITAWALLKDRKKEDMA